MFYQKMAMALIIAKTISGDRVMTDQTQDSFPADDVQDNTKRPVQSDAVQDVCDSVERERRFLEFYRTWKQTEAEGGYADFVRRAYAAQRNIPTADREQQSDSIVKPHSPGPKKPD